MLARPLRRAALAAGAVTALLAAAACGGGGQPGHRASAPHSSRATTASPSEPFSPHTSAGPPSSSSPEPTSSPGRSSPRACDLRLSHWTTRQLAGALIIAPVQLGNLAAARSMIASGIGGIILYGGPPPASLASQLSRLRAAAPRDWPLLVASDEEGGGVQRLAQLTGGLPWPREQAHSGPGGVRRNAERLGAKLRQLGVNVDLAPVADLDAGPGPNNRHPDGKRSFSADPETAAADVVAFTRGLQRQGVSAVVKHFPGLGTASRNTDVGPASTAPWSQLRTRDVKPFAAAIRSGVDAVMTANATVPGLTDGPASLSRAATTTALRDGLGFQRVVITDSLSAGAISQAGLSVPQAAVRALQAGADDVLFGTGGSRHGARAAAQVRSAIAAAVQSHRLSKAQLRRSATRVARTLGAKPC
jgi:beta-N-acetylhexosaminidase